MADNDAVSTAGKGKEMPKLADFDELVDEVLARKGPSKYTDGLSEDNWEEVSKSSFSVSVVNFCSLCYRLDDRSWRRFHCL